MRSERGRCPPARPPPQCPRAQRARTPPWARASPSLGGNATAARPRRRGHLRTHVQAPACAVCRGHSRLPTAPVWGARLGGASRCGFKMLAITRPGGCTAPGAHRTSRPRSGLCRRSNTRAHFTAPSLLQREPLSRSAEGLPLAPCCQAPRRSSGRRGGVCHPAQPALGRRRPVV